ncbi:MAG: restriction endonuclease [Firmicutes bacterium]|nr:restriction endonuclease [Bacillota bacterium]
MNSLLPVLVPKIEVDPGGFFTQLGFWLLVVTGLLLAVIYYIRSTREIHRLQADLDDIDRMGPDDFEDFVKSLLMAEGFSAESPTSSSDGVNLLVTDWRGGRTAVQARRSGLKERINKESVRNLLEAKRRHGYDRVLIVTNSRLTHWADEYARANSIETWDREVLRQFLGRSRVSRAREAMRGNLFRPPEYHKKRNR